LLFRKLVLPFVICAAVACAPAAHAVPRLRQVDGGPRYYARFSHALPSNPRYFPIGVWGSYDQTQTNIDKDKAVGLDLYVWPSDETIPISIFRANGMHALFAEDWHGQPGIATSTVNDGYLLGDEEDMCCGPPGYIGGNGYQHLTDANNLWPADNRMRHANFGKGVMFWETDADAARFVNLPFLGIASADVYWFTDPNQIDMIAPSWLPERGHRMTLSEVRRAANYGYQIDRLRALDRRDGRRKPIWAFVEVGWPFTESAAQGARYIGPAEIRAAVWHSLIAGARGVIYFNASFGGPERCQTHNVLRDVDCSAPVRATVRAVNRQMKRLAPVLNAWTVTSGWRTSPSIRAMVKWHGRRLYVFAGSRNNRARTGRFFMRCIGNARAVRLGDKGNVPVRHGSFSDSFADGNAIHIYRIRGGSTCGLARRLAR
jgi:hypothetical protein